MDCLYRSFQWNSAKYTPGAIDYPVLCWTENDKLMVLKNTKIRDPYNRNQFISHWIGLVNNYKIKYWVYQSALINNS